MSRVKGQFGIRLSSIAYFVAAFIMMAFGTLSPIGQLTASAITADAYCSSYASTELNACKDGIRGVNCSQAYAPPTFSAGDTQTCTNAENAVSSGAVTGTPSFLPSSSAPSSSGGSGGNGGAGGGSNPLGSLGQLGGADQLGQMSQLTQYVGQLHQSGSDAGSNPSLAANNNFGSYANSAGGQQAMTVLPSGQHNGPAIIYFMSQDGSGDPNAGKSLASGADSAVGGGANARGYTIIEISTRTGTGGANFGYEDAVRGVQHVLQNAAQYDIDPQKVAVMGDSDGGAMAVRVASSGRSGVKAAVGWSASTNEYTSMFQNNSTFQQGVSQLPCLNQPQPGTQSQSPFGQSGSTAATPNSGSLGALSQVLSIAQYANGTGQSPEAISQGMNGSNGINGLSGAGGSPINMPAKTFIQCIGDLNSQSPALEASPATPPTFLAGFDNDELVSSQQLYDMRDKLSGMGITTDTLIIPGDPNAQPKNGCSKKNHLCYDGRFVCKTLNFLDTQIQKSKQPIDCQKGVNPNAGSTKNSGGGGGGGNGSKQSNGGPSGGSPAQPAGNGGGCGNVPGCTEATSPGQILTAGGQNGFPCGYESKCSVAVPHAPADINTPPGVQFNPGIKIDTGCAIPGGTCN